MSIDFPYTEEEGADVEWQEAWIEKKKGWCSLSYSMSLEQSRKISSYFC